MRRSLGPSRVAARRAAANRARRRAARTATHLARAARRAARPWWLLFPWEWQALRASLPAEYDDFTYRVIGRALVCNGTVTVPETGKQRRLAIIFRGPPSRTDPLVMADGPRRSRHRYKWSRPTSLCMWHPSDPASQRWTPRNGFGVLIDVARTHLLKELWWRRHGRWDSPEVHEAPRGDEARPTGIGRRVRRFRQRNPPDCWCGHRNYAACHGAIPAADELTLLGLT